MCPHFDSRMNIFVLNMQQHTQTHRDIYRWSSHYITGSLDSWEYVKQGTSSKDVDWEAHLENAAPSALFNHTDKLRRRDLVQLHPSQVSFNKSHYVDEIGKQTGREVIH